MLTHSLAQEIAREMAAVTQLGILLTDPEGIVIGSSDPRRLDTLHEASIEVARTREAAAHTPAQVVGLTGVRPGVTLPLVVDDVVVGTVGITGAPNRVRRFGPVVRRHAEMLLRQSAVLQSQILRDHALEQLVGDIATYDAGLVEPELIASRAADLGYDLGLLRVAIVIRVPAAAPAHRGDGAPPPSPELRRNLREWFSDHQTIVANSPPSLYTIFYHPAQHHSPADAEQSTTTRCHQAIDGIRRQHRLAAQAGIGTSARSLVELHASYQDACDALKLGPRAHGNSAIHHISQLRPHQLVASTDRRVRFRTTAAQLVGVHSAKDWPTLRQTLIAWGDQGFNLVSAAQELHIHRNTLVLRLARVATLTGRDLHDRRTALGLYLAGLADLLDEESPSPSQRSRRDRPAHSSRVESARERARGAS